MWTCIYLAAGFCALVVVGAFIYCGIIATRDDFELMNDWRNDQRL